MQLCHQFHNTIKNMKYNYVLPYIKGMKVHYLEFLINKLRMEKGLKGISEENPDFSMTCQSFQKNSLTFPGFQRFFVKTVFLQVF